MRGTFKIYRPNQPPLCCQLRLKKYVSQDFPRTFFNKGAYSKFSHSEFETTYLQLQFGLRIEDLVVEILVAQSL